MTVEFVQFSVCVCLKLEYHKYIHKRISLTAPVTNGIAFVRKYFEINQPNAPTKSLVALFVWKSQTNYHELYNSSQLCLHESIYIYSWPPSKYYSSNKHTSEHTHSMTVYINYSANIYIYVCRAKCRCRHRWQVNIHIQH